MIRTLTATTEYIDDMDAAVQDITTQLDCEHNLLQYSAGIIACHYEFALSGALKAIGSALPFETVGSITSTNGTPRGAGVLQLTIMVLTSDDTRFKSALSASLKTDPAQVVAAAYTENAGQGERPVMLLSYAPFMVENSGDDYVSVLSRVSGGVPCFGTLSIDDTPDFHNCFSLHNGEYYGDRMSLLFIYGDMRPRFFLASISPNKVLNRPAQITASAGHVLKEINGRPVTEFFEEMGLTNASETSYALTSLPFMLDYRDGTPLVARVFISLNQDKHAICAGAMPQGAALYMGVFDKEDVLLTTGNSIREAAGGGEGISGMLIYSCLSRSMTLGADLYAEAGVIVKETGGRIPYLLACSGGELCPTQVNDGIAVNRFHNNTCIICVF
ncbi:MAG: FIST C-terminal domain-containing protein [Treponema sp.]|jgi:hypothetical protein|nr:FIST C-terminal domain-containing protein [Treponema sp.]